MLLNDPRSAREPLMLQTFLRSLAILSLCLPLGTTAAELKPSFNSFGVHMTLETSGADTKGASATLRVEVPPGGGPPAAHIHTREDETYVVTRGHFRFWYGTHVVDATPGTVVFLPRNVAHQWLNIGKTPGEHIMTMAPAGLERFFLQVGKQGLGPKDRAEIERLSTVYGIRYVPSLMKPAPQK